MRIVRKNCSVLKWSKVRGVINSVVELNVDYLHPSILPLVDQAMAVASKIAKSKFHHQDERRPGTFAAKSHSAIII